MTLVETLRRDLHGELIGGTGLLFCDYTAVGCPPFDATGPICYEAIRVVDAPSLEGRLPIPEGWVLDASRCPTHAVSRLPYRTAGFDEALLTFEVRPVENGTFAVDGASIRVIDRSFADEGEEPVPMPPHVIPSVVAVSDYGYERLARQECLLTPAVRAAYPDYAAAIDTAMERDSRGRPPPSASEDHETGESGGPSSPTVGRRDDRITWLPPRPYRLDEARQNEQTPQIVAFEPIFGLEPDPDEAVVVLYIVVHDQFLWTAFDPDEETWIRIASGPVREFFRDHLDIRDRSKAFVEQGYPDESLTLIGKVHRLT